MTSSIKRFNNFYKFENSDGNQFGLYHLKDEDTGEYHIIYNYYKNGESLYPQINKIVKNVNKYHDLLEKMIKKWSSKGSDFCSKLVIISLEFDYCLPAHNKN